MMNENKEKRRALVIGATGCIGGPVVRELSDDPGSDGLTVLAAVRNQGKAEAFRERGIETVTLDLDDVDSVRAAVRTVDRIFLLTGYTVEMLQQSKTVVDATYRKDRSPVVGRGREQRGRRGPQTGSP